MLRTLWMVALVAVVVVPACGSTRVDRTRSERLPAAVVPRDRPDELSCPALPGGVAGFDLGQDGSIGAAGLRCQRAGYEWTPMDDGGTCSETPLRVLYPASARILSCAQHGDGPRTSGAAASGESPRRTFVCAIQLRYEFGGETALRTGVTRIYEELREHYHSDGEWIEDEARPCPRVEGDTFGCVLDGIGIAQYYWRVADPDDRPGPCDHPNGLIALRAEGDRGTHDGRVTVTYVTRDAVEEFERTAF